MQHLDDNASISLVNKGSLFSIHEYQKPGEERFILKAIEGKRPSAKQILLLNTEYEIARQIQSKSARKVIQKTEYNGKPALLLEYIDGVNLLTRYPTPLPLPEFLGVAINLSNALGALHECRVIHKDLQPINILVEHETDRIVFINFGIASRLTRENKLTSNINLLESNLEYTAPEQTGRMNRSVDYRADLYTLGIILYKLFTGRTPFQSNDTLHLIHSHMALPVDVSAIPEPLNIILKKLLAKNAEDRYQSAYGLRFDLEKCLEQFKSTGKLTPFELGQQDFSLYFQIPQKLYGRTAEIKELLENFEAVSQGSAHLLLIKGYSGIGKSALVQEVNKPITAQKGFFISGKFDQYQRNIPYFALLRAFQGLVSQLLTEKGEKLAEWKENILQAVGINGQIITEVIPQVELIIGAQSPVGILPPLEAQNRFLNTFLNFIRVFARAEHPLVLFLDDLQWADTASINLIQSVLLDDRVRYLLILGAYRDNEVDTMHPLSRMLDTLEDENAPMSSIHLKPLPLPEIISLVTETLRSGADESAELCSLLEQKTGGNPFFLTQFLNHLYDDELIRFDPTSQRWQWEIGVIREQNITDNVVALMTQKIRQLPPETQELLKVAACIGNEFDLYTLAAVSRKPELEVARLLWKSIEEGLTPPLDENYRAYQGLEAAKHDEYTGLNAPNARYTFLHDRIQQAAYDIISAEERDELHLRIGRRMLQTSPDEQRDEHLFDILIHFNLSRHLMSNADELETCARMNLQAGRKASASTAYASAVSYLRSGIDMLDRRHWSTEMYDLSYNLYYACSEALYLSGDHAGAEVLLDVLQSEAQNKTDQAKVFLLRGILYTNVGKIVEALHACKVGLTLYDLSVPESVSDEAFIQGLMRVKELRGDRSVESLIDLPNMASLDSYMRLLLLSVMATPAFFLDNKLWIWTVTQLVQISLEDGNSDLSDLGYVAFGLVLGSGLGEYETGYEYGKLALNLNHKFNKVENRAKVNVVFGTMNSHWNTSAGNNIAYATEAFELGRETGDLIYAGYGASQLTWCRYMIGTPMEQLVEDCDKNYRFHLRNRDLSGDAILIARCLIDALQGRTNAPTSFEQKDFREEELFQRNLAYPIKQPLHHFYLAKMRLSYLFDQYEEALSFAEKAETVADASFGCVYIPDQVEYHALSLLALYDQATEENRAKYRGTIDALMGRLQVWAEKAPQNWRSKFRLVEAETYRIFGVSVDAAEAFDDAIKLAAENGFTQDEALANELATQFYLRQGKEKIARAYLYDALRLYEKWGAFAKVRHLSQKYSKFIDKLPEHSDTQQALSFDPGHSESLDLYTIMKAYAAISAEVMLENLLRKMLDLILENAGAQRCVFLSAGPQGELLLQGDGSVDQNERSVLQNIPMTGTDDVPAAVVRYVARTRESLLLNKAVQDENFNHDPYVQKHLPQSVLCLPAIHQGKFLGVVYLEHRQAVQAFTPGRVELVNLLIVQMAVSIDNAILYRSLEEKVKERTLIIEEQKKELEKEKQKSDRLLYNILPVSTAEELKETGKATPKSFESVTVLFTDFKGFTRIVEHISPEELINTLNEVFVAFDEISKKHRLEPIKTIGDSFMCAGGIPEVNNTHPSDAVYAGLEMQEFIVQWNLKRISNGLERLDLRLGIHTGPVIAGVIGMRKFAYDIWGDAVNVASRLESSGVPGEVNISQATHKLVSGMFLCEPRGKIYAKHKGEIEMYLVKSIL